jgi:hypothetical protein
VKKTLIAFGASLLLAVSAAAPIASARPNACQSVQAVFYTSGDWLRLAHTLAADASPCAQYYISIPPLASSKTTIRSNAARQVRALGANFHALAEVSYSAWQGWVSSTGNSWYQAGQEARRRMADAGFDVAAGDTWVVNEISSAAIAGTGQARQNFRQLLAGLHDGDGSVAQTKGIVYVVGVSQSMAALPSYKAQLESWLQDSGFWTDMASYVSAFYQEVYGDVRSYAVPGLDAATRIGYLNQYLHYLQQLAAVAPPGAAAAQSFLASAYGPLANAAWAWNSGYGFTNVDSPTMADFVSAETYALRTAGDPRIGFAWDAANPNGLGATDFRTQTTGVLVRLAGAIHETDAGDPTQACVATGCSAVLDGAAPATGWSTFGSWTPTLAAFTTPPQTLQAATPSSPITIQLQTGGIATALPNPTTVSLSSSSSTGTFAVDPNGPWTSSLTLTIPPGTNSASFYLQDSAGGSPTLVATTGGLSTTQVETINGPVAPPTPAPPPPPPAQIGSLTLGQVGNLLHVDVQVVDASRNPLQARVSLAVVQGSSLFASTSGRTDAGGRFGLTASRRPAPGCYQAQVQSVSVPGYAWDGTTPPASLCVRPSPTVDSLAFTRRRGRVHLAVRVLGSDRRPLRARVSLAIVRGTSTFASTSATTSAAGTLGLTASRKPAPGCYTARVGSVSAPGYTWNRSAPAARICVRK